MGRHPQPDIRRRLLERCTDYALANGLPHRLAPLAESTGVSTRMLLYHFGTRDDLLREVLREARQRQLQRFGDVLRAVPDEPYADTLARAWSVMTGSDGRQFVQLFTDLRENAGQSLWPGFKHVATTDWLEPLEEGLRNSGRAASATLVLAVMRGLLMDFDATGDTDRVDRAFDEFLSTALA